MENWTRAEIVGLIALVVAVVAAIANILVMKSSRSRRALLFLLIVIVLAFLGLLYKIESTRVAAQNRETQNAARRDEAKREEAKQAEIKREEAKIEEQKREEEIRQAKENLQRENAELENINARLKQIEESRKEVEKRIEQQPKKAAPRVVEADTLIAAKQAIIGDWNAQWTLRFLSDGTFQITSNPFGIRNYVGSYHFIDSAHVEVTYRSVFSSGPGISYQIIVTIFDDTLHIKSENILLKGNFTRD